MAGDGQMPQLVDGATQQHAAQDPPQQRGHETGQQRKRQGAHRPRAEDAQVLHQDARLGDVDQAHVDAVPRDDEFGVVGSEVQVRGPDVGADACVYFGHGEPAYRPGEGEGDEDDEVVVADCVGDSAACEEAEEHD